MLGNANLTLIGAIGVIMTILSRRAPESTRRSACPAPTVLEPENLYVVNGQATLPDP